MNPSSNPVPAMTHPWGKYWEQPDPETFLFDDSCVLMTERDFSFLREYSGTIPTGAYEGKMWRRNDGLFDPRCPEKDRVWMLCWYGPGEDHGYVRVHYRKILTV